MSETEVEGKFDTFEQVVLSRINGALNQEQFVQLNSNEWDELYITLFLNLYAQMCRLNNFTIIKHDRRVIEPVTIHVDPNQRVDEIPKVTHRVSIPFLKWIFSYNPSKRVNSKFKCQFKMPSIFPLVQNYDETNSGFLPKILHSEVAQRIIQYYVFADHAAYHYHQFIDLKNADYEHKYIINRPSNLKPREVKFCHDIISYKPNKFLNRYLQSHDILKIEEKEAEDSYVNISYGQLFQICSEDNNN